MVKLEGTELNEELKVIVVFRTFPSQLKGFWANPKNRKTIKPITRNDRRRVGFKTKLF